MLQACQKSLVLFALCVGALVAGGVHAQTAPPAKPVTKPAAKPAAAKPAPAPNRPRVAPAAAAVATTAAVAAVLTPGQLEAAERVLLGTAKCEFNEEVQLSSEHGKPGHFVMRHKHHSYNMVPVETSTGAIRLEDKKQGVMWLQIPSKSMLMNTRIGQRLIDDCTMSQQQGS